MARLVLKGGSVFDGTGSPPAVRDIVIEDGRFAEPGAARPDDTVADVTGHLVVPGLINTHVHVVGCAPTLEERLRTPFSYQFYASLPILDDLLSGGMTTARDLAGADAGVRQALADGTIEGPRLQIAIEALSPTGGHIDAWLPSGLDAFEYYLPHPARPHGVVDGAAEIRTRIRELLRAGADLIKICTTNGGVWPRKNYLPAHFRDDELAAVMAEARTAGVPVAAHAQGAEGVKNAVRAGVTSIEHGTHLDREAVDLMAEHGTWFVPTLARTCGILDKPEVAARVGKDKLVQAQRIAEAHAESFRLATEAGVRIAMGTDMFGGEFLDELHYMSEFGLNSTETLAASTSGAAELLGLSDTVGRIAPGMAADLVVLDGEALTFSRLRSRIRAVVQNGGCVRGELPAATPHEKS
ncbi:amidohydrolase family protein [Streptomyces sp. NPDC051018]|uniref:metal-dependent hydrolase family protein n=1 Tax=Streptomyces sp. NPDC051018 TaxID=3365639 RepID=UPI00378BADD3